jgi:hypothetical protein
MAEVPLNRVAHGLGLSGPDPGDVRRHRGNPAKPGRPRLRSLGSGPGRRKKSPDPTLSGSPVWRIPGRSGRPKGCAPLGLSGPDPGDLRTSGPYVSEAWTPARPGNNSCNAVNLTAQSILRSLGSGPGRRKAPILHPERKKKGFPHPLTLLGSGPGRPKKKTCYAWRILGPHWWHTCPPALGLWRCGTFETGALRVSRVRTRAM